MMIMRQDLHVRLAQGGSALVVSLVFLLLLSLVALAGVQGSTSQERMAANLKFKNDTLQSAEAVLRLVEAGVNDQSIRLPHPGDPLAFCAASDCDLDPLILDLDHTHLPAGWKRVSAAAAGNEADAWYRIVLLGHSDIPANVAASSPSTLYRVFVVSFKGTSRTVLEGTYAFSRL